MVVRGSDEIEGDAKRRRVDGVLSTVELRTGSRLPCVGLGLWKSKPDEADAAVRAALEVGVRLLDCAAAYGNESGVGTALEKAFQESIVKREDVFVVSKLPSTHHVWAGDLTRVREAMDKTLDDLRLGYVDLYLMHWPFAFEQTNLGEIGGLRLPDGTPNPKLVMMAEFLETYGEMLKLVEVGKARAIGVCNFTQAQLESLIDRFPSDPPCVNQVELHPYLTQKDLAAFCDAKGIRMMAYSPLGSGDSYSGRSFPAKGTGPFENPNAGSTLLSNEVVQEVAKKVGKSPAQVLIRWSLQQGHVCIPKSARAERIRENFEVLSWSLPDADAARLDALDCGFRYGIGFMEGHYDCPNAPWSKI